MDLRFAIVGLGSVGKVLKFAFESAGFQVAAVLGRHDNPAGLSETISAVAICTPDDAIPGVAHQLAQSSPSWSDRIAFHVSGALTSEVLRPLADAGARTLGFHPLSTYPPDSEPRSLAGTTVALEGMPDAVATMREVAIRLGAVPTVLTSGQKGAYHVAASMASNFLVTLQGAVSAILEATDLDPHLMDGLVGDTIENLHGSSAAEALTGPIARGDVETVGVHIQTLRSVAPHLLPFYESMAAVTIDMAFETGRIDQTRRERIIEILSTARGKGT